MASFSSRGDQILAQVRKKQGGIVVFSESKLFPTLILARSWATRLEAKIAKEGIGRVERARLTVGDLILKHLEYQQSLRTLGRSTVQNHEYMAQQLSKIRLPDLKAKDLIDFARRRKAEGAAPATILANLSPVSAALNAAPYAHGIDADAREVALAIRKLTDMGLAAKSRQVMRLVDQEEETALLEEFGRRNQMPQTEINMVLAYRWALALPRRAGELTRMTWKDINPHKRTIIIRDVKHPRRKIGNDQEVPLLGPAWDLLEQTPKLDGRLLPYNSESMCSAFERVRDRIAQTGLPRIGDLRFHDLRHTGITMLFWRGLAIQEVAIVSGHSNWSQLKRYTHIRPEDLHRHFSPAKDVDLGRLQFEPAPGGN